jgi:3-O-methylgallate 3,4-dioxygenase
MAEIVLGIGTSHSPQVSTTWEVWSKMRQTDERSPAIPPNLLAQLEPGVLSERFGSVQLAVQTIAHRLQSTADLDAIVIFGDDQHEQFDDVNMPAIAVYHGEQVPVTPPRMAFAYWTP